MMSELSKEKGGRQIHMALFPIATIQLGMHIMERYVVREREEGESLYQLLMYVVMDLDELFKTSADTQDLANEAGGGNNTQQQAHTGLQGIGTAEGLRAHLNKPLQFVLQFRKLCGLLAGALEKGSVKIEVGSELLKFHSFKQLWDYYRLGEKIGSTLFPSVLVPWKIPQDAAKALIGNGAYGKVYLAEWVLGTCKQQRKVAIKQLNSTEGKITAGRFLNILFNETCGIPRHPNIVLILGVYYDLVGGKAEIVMNYGGIRTRAFLSRFSASETCPLPLFSSRSPPQTEQSSNLIVLREIVRQLVAALNCLREQGGYHLDLKPDNILVDPHTGTVCLVDFGGVLGTKGYLHKSFGGDDNPRDVGPNQKSVREGRVRFALAVTIWEWAMDRSWVSKGTAGITDPTPLDHIDLLSPEQGASQCPSFIKDLLSPQDVSFEEAFQNKFPEWDLSHSLQYCQVVATQTLRDISTPENQSVAALAALQDVVAAHLAVIPRAPGAVDQFLDAITAADLWLPNTLVEGLELPMATAEIQPENYLRGIYLALASNLTMYGSYSIELLHCVATRIKDSGFATSDSIVAAIQAQFTEAVMSNEGDVVKALLKSFEGVVSPSARMVPPLLEVQDKEENLEPGTESNYDPSWTAMHQAAAYGNTEMLEVLLAAPGGVNVNCTVNLRVKHIHPHWLLEDPTTVHYCEKVKCVPALFDEASASEDFALVASSSAASPKTSCNTEKFYRESEQINLKDHTKLIPLFPGPTAKHPNIIGRRVHPETNRQIAVIEDSAHQDESLESLRKTELVAMGRRELQSSRLFIFHEVSAKVIHNRLRYFRYGVEYCDLGPLSLSMRAYTGNQIACRHILRQLLQALVIMEKLTIVHLGLEPSVVMLSSTLVGGTNVTELTGEDRAMPFVKLPQNSGMVKVSGHERAVKQQAKQWYYKRVPTCYMAPEARVADIPTPNTSQNCYTAACIAYELITGHRWDAEGGQADCCRQEKLQRVPWPLARHLLGRLLEDQSTRLKAAQALEHPWMSDSWTAPPVEQQAGGGGGGDDSSALWMVETVINSGGVVDLSSLPSLGLDRQSAWVQDMEKIQRSLASKALEAPTAGGPSTAAVKPMALPLAFVQCVENSEIQTTLRSVLGEGASTALSKFTMDRHEQAVEFLCRHDVAEAHRLRSSLRNYREGTKAGCVADEWWVVALAMCDSLVEQREKLGASCIFETLDQEVCFEDSAKWVLRKAAGGSKQLYSGGMSVQQELGMLVLFLVFPSAASALSGIESDEVVLLFELWYKEHKPQPAHITGLKQLDAAAAASSSKKKPLDTRFVEKYFIRKCLQQKYKSATEAVAALRSAAALAGLKVGNEVEKNPLTRPLIVQQRDYVLGLRKEKLPTQEDFVAQGVSPLHLATQRSHREVVQLLLQNGADQSRAFTYVDAPKAEKVSVSCCTKPGELSFQARRTPLQPRSEAVHADPHSQAEPETTKALALHLQHMAQQDPPTKAGTFDTQTQVHRKRYTTIREEEQSESTVPFIVPDPKSSSYNVEKGEKDAPDTQNTLRYTRAMDTGAKERNAEHDVSSSPQDVASESK